MTSNLLNTLNKLIEFKTISNNFISIQQKFSKSAKNVLNIDFKNSVIDCIKVFRSNLKVIELKQNSNKLKCFWPKCQFTSRYKYLIRNHQIIHKNINHLNVKNVIKLLDKNLI